MKTIIFIMLMLVGGFAEAQSDESCARYAAYREASGEPVQGIRAVMQVISNRMRIDKMSACQVVTKPGQFSWMNSSVDWKVPKQWLTKYRAAAKLESQVPDTVYYFNSVRFKKIGIFHSKIGGIYFYHKENLV